MLTETLLLAPSRTPTDGVDTPSIALYNLHTGAPTGSLKRSHTSAFTSTRSHLFTQQADKSVVNVYNTSSLSLETTIPFPEPFTVLSASPCGSYVAAGTAGGRVYLWELASGRFVATPPTHLQRITAVAWARGGHLVVGSEDTNISVWSVPAVLDTRGGVRTAERVLDRHIHAVTGIAVGAASCGGASELLVTAARDRSVITWELHTGQHLRTFIVGGVPLCLALDPAERAVYVGLEEGGIQCVDFYAADKGSAKEMYSDQFRDMPVTVDGEVWGGEGAGAVLSIAVSYEGNLVVSGNVRGEVGLWDVATGCLFKNLCQMKAPLTSMQILPPTGFTSSGQDNTATTALPVLPKPRYEAILAATSNQTYDPSTYTLSLTLPSSIPETSTSPLSTHPRKERVHTFGPVHDMDEILRGAQEMKAFKPALAGKQRTEALEAELASLYESYERLADVHRKTWSGMVGMVLEDGGKNGTG